MTFFPKLRTLKGENNLLYVRIVFCTSCHAGGTLLVLAFTVRQYLHSCKLVALQRVKATSNLRVLQTRVAFFAYLVALLSFCIHLLIMVLSAIVITQLYSCEIQLNSAAGSNIHNDQRSKSCIVVLLKSQSSSSSVRRKKTI